MASVVVFLRKVFLSAFLISTASSAMPTENAVLTTPPQVPPVIERSTPEKVIVEIEIIEKAPKRKQHGE